MLVISIIIIFVGVAVAPSISGINFKSVTSKIENESSSQDCYPVSFFVFDKSGRVNHEVFVSRDVVENISVLLEELRECFVSDPFGDDTFSLQVDFIDLLDLYGLLPEGVSRDYLLSLVNPPWFRFLERILALTSGSPFLRSPVLSFLSNFFDVDGSGSVLPKKAEGESKLVFMSNIGGVALGFLIPPYMLPRPRGLVAWTGSEGSTTYVGSMVQDESFFAMGAQQALALGFIGFGISIYFGWLAFAFIGLAGVLFINAKSFIDVGPPNKVPVVSNENPVDGAVNVPVSLSELSFRISDGDGDRMSYSVSTSPNVGSGSGNLKKDGVYSAPVSGLKPNTVYSWTVEVSDGEDTVVEDFSFITEMLPFDPFDEGWQYRKKITIDHNKVDGDLSGFPVLISVVDSDLRDKAQADGDDILFMDGPGIANRLFHEIEKYESSSGELVSWVRLPNIDNEMDTSFYLYYGNPDTASIDLHEEVWDENYCAVWHLDDTKDSTLNKNHGSLSGSSTNWKTGNSGIGLEILKKGMVKNIPVSFDNSISTEYTLNCWINWYGKDPSYPDFSYIFDARVPSYGGGCILYLLEDGTVMFLQFTGSSFVRLRSANTISKNIWTHLSVLFNYNSQNLRLFIDGVEDNSTSITNQYIDTDLNPVMGNNLWGSGSTYRPLNGVLDELRLSNIERSDDWIKAGYNNQNNHSSFMSFGPEETGP
jgi:hypothetical protein